MDKNRRTKGTGRIWFDSKQKVYKGRIRINGKDKYLTLTGNERESQTLWKKFLEKEKPASKLDKARIPLDDVWSEVRDKIAVSHGIGTNTNPYWPVWNNFKDKMKKKGRKYLDEITDTDTAVYVQEEFNHLSSQTYNIYLSYLKRIFHFAGFDEKTNPMTNIGTKAVVQESREALTHDEIQSLLKTAKEKGEEWHRLIIVGLNTGLRCKDCLYLTSENIKDGMITTVPMKTMKRSGKKVFIPLNDALRKELDGIEGEFFPTLKQEYLRCQPYFSERLNGLFRESGIETTKTVPGRTRKASVKGFHALRVVFITELSKSGVGLGLIQSMAGHVGGRQTQSYVNPDKDALQQAVNAIPNFESGEKGTDYIPPEIKKVMDACRESMRQAVREYLGVDAKVEGTWKITGMDGKPIPFYTKEDAMAWKRIEAKINAGK